MTKCLTGRCNFKKMKLIKTLTFFTKNAEVTVNFDSKTVIITGMESRNTEVRKFSWLELCVVEEDGTAKMRLMPFSQVYVLNYTANE